MWRKKPETGEERKALHETLMGYATSAEKTGAFGGLSALLRSYGDTVFINLIVRWFETFTSIRREKNDSVLLFCAHKSTRGVRDLGTARLNPYYSMLPEGRICKSISVSGTHSSLDACGISDREFKKKTIHIALDAFFIERSHETKQRLINLINSFDTTEVMAKGSPFVQAGAPGLGRRR
jgi:hypothetical protein